MTLLRSASISVILSTAFIMGGCSNKNKGPSAEKSAPAVALGLKAPSDKVFAKHFDVPAREVSDAEGREALAALNLLTESDDGLNWASTSGSDGNYSYTDLTVKDEDGQMSIAKAKLIGVHMDGETATFDRADFSGIKIYDQTEDTTITMGTLSVARPTPDMAKAIITSLQNIKDLEDLDLDIDDKDADMGFGALGIGDVSITSKELNLSTESLVWGEDPETNLTDFKVQDVALNFTQNADEPVTASLKSFSATGLRGDMMKNLPDGRSGPLGMMSGFNPLAKMYSTLKMEELDFDSNFVSVTSEGFEGKSTEKGGVTTQKSVGEPFIIRLKEAPKDPQAKQAYEMVKELGFDEIVLQSSQTTVMDSNEDTIAVKDGLLSMKDGFKLSYNYGASGVKAMTDKMQSLESGTMDSRESQANMQAAMGDVKLSGLQLRLEDQSIVERGLKLAGKFRGASADQVKKEIKVALAFAPMMASGLEGEMLGEISGAFGTFIENGGTLSIVMDPKTPLSVSELANYKGSQLTMDDIGFSAKAE